MGHQPGWALYEPVMRRRPDGRYELDHLEYHPLPRGKVAPRRHFESVDEFLARGGQIRRVTFNSRPAPERPPIDTVAVLKQFIREVRKLSVAERAKPVLLTSKTEAHLWRQAILHVDPAAQLVVEPKDADVEDALWRVRPPRDGERPA